jgi:WD40 repeat protein
VASAGYDGAVRLWDVTTGTEILASPLRHAGGATSVAISPNGQRLASGGLDRTVRICDTATWRELRMIHDPTGGVQSVAWSPDGRRLAWGGRDATIKVGDPATGTILQTLRGHTSWVESVVFSRPMDRLGQPGWHDKDLERAAGSSSIRPGGGSPGLGPGGAAVITQGV